MNNNIIKNNTKLNFSKEKDFCFLISLILIVLSAHGIYAEDWSISNFFIGMTFSLCFFALGILKPSLVAMPLRLWMTLGEFLGKFISPIVLAVIFFFVITPVSLAIRLFGRDQLRLKRNNMHTFWIDRDSEMQPSNTFKTQF